MFRNISMWALMLSAVSSVLASPLSSSSYDQNTEAGLVERQIPCPVGQNCGPGPVCAGSLCELDVCQGTSLCVSETKKRSEPAPMVARGFGCPPDIPCGAGPVCTGSFCELDECKGSSLCVNQTEKRNEPAPLAARGFGCGTDIPCGPGPECTVYTCDVDGCKDADVCQESEDRKRNAESDFLRPTCDICIVGHNGTRVCGCAAPAKESQKRAAACPLYCIVPEDGNGEELCGCAAKEYRESHGN